MSSIRQESAPPKLPDCAHDNFDNARCLRFRYPPREGVTEIPHWCGNLVIRTFDAMCDTNRVGVVARLPRNYLPLPGGTRAARSGSGRALRNGLCNGLRIGD